MSPFTQASMWLNSLRNSAETERVPRHGMIASPEMGTRLYLAKDVSVGA